MLSLLEDEASLLAVPTHRARCEWPSYIDTHLTSHGHHRLLQTASKVILLASHQLGSAGSSSEVFSC